MGNVLKRAIIGLIAILFAGVSIVGILFTSVIAAVVGSDEDVSANDGNFELIGLSDAVLNYKPVVEEYALEHDVSDYVNIILAIMMQESGGNGDDPMQSSESKCGKVGCITTPEESIEQGIKYFKKALERSDYNLLVAIQSYNYGLGFADWIKGKGGEYTPELAIDFSRIKYQSEIDNGRGDLYYCYIGDAFVLGACYGDYLYVQHVMRYVKSTDIIIEGSGIWSDPLSIGMRVTSGFRTSERPNHNGIDYSCNRKNIPIYAVDDGVVEESLYGRPNPNGNGFGTYGNVVLIKHNDDLYSLYAHMNERFVEKGQKIERGQAIGTCGGSGNSGLDHYVIHLHLEARTTKFGGHISPATLLK